MDELERRFVQSTRENVRALSDQVGALPSRALAAMRWQATETLRIVSEEEERRGVPATKVPDA